MMMVMMTMVAKVVVISRGRYLQGKWDFALASEFFDANLQHKHSMAVLDHIICRAA